MPAAKKYKLFSNSQEGTRPPCAFFASPEGCRNGDKCKFAHEKESVPSIPSENGSVISSESSQEGEMKEKKQEVEDFPFTTTAAAVQKELGEKKKKNRRSKKSENDLPFASPKKKVRLSAETAKPPKNAKKEKQQSKEKASPQQSPALQAGTPEYLSLNLPIASFTMPADTPKTAKASENKPEPPTKTEEEPIQKERELPTPDSTEVGRKWLAAVVQSRKHFRYQRSYDFAKFMQLDEGIGAGGKTAWIKAKPFGDWCKNNPQAIAMDCEMCETQDPVSGQRDPRALCRISILNAENGQVLLDSLVKPAWPVIDYRTQINGIVAEHLENVQFTLRHAQAFMMALCSEETVMLGHAVHNDLAALRMEHYCVADSANLFKAADSDSATVSLKDMAASVLKKVMPDKHDSVNDAHTALACLQHYLDKNGKIEPVVRSVSLKPSYGCQLFIHRIPKKMCDESHLPRMFLLHTSVEPSEVEDIEYTGEMGKTHVIFRTLRHANLAFDTLEGKAEPDASGRLQKKVYLRGGGYIRVRKMAFEKDSSKAGPKRLSTS